MPKIASRQYRQLLLLLSAVMLPSAPLVVLAFRAHRQEQALAHQAQIDARIQAARQLGQRLALTLGELRLRQVTAFTSGRPAAPDSAVVLAARLANGIVQGPRARAAVAVPPDIAMSLRTAEAVEASGRAAEAVRLYRRALLLARDTALMAHVRLGIARALVRSGDERGATAAYAWLLALPFDITDDEGIPFALYAAERLKWNNQHRPAVAARLAERLGERVPLGRLETYMLRDIADSLVDFPSSGNLRNAARSRIAIMEQLAALKRDLPTLLRLRLGGSGHDEQAAVWLPYGEPLWLVNAAPTPAGVDTILVVVAAWALERSLNAEPSISVAGSVRIAAAGTLAGAELLGPELPGIAVALPDGTISLPNRTALLVPLLVLIVMLTTLAAYLLWRDVRRETRAAALRSRFVSAVSHELKTPLTSIRMFAEMLRMRPDDAKTRAAFLDTIVGESERLTRLIENVLHFSRLDEQRQSYRLVPGDLGAVVREAAEAMAYPITQEGLRLHVDVDPCVPAVPLDRDALVQAILNLLSNAVKFSPGGSEISLRLERLNGDALIAVRDQGMGIERHEHARIFDEFYRSPSTEASGIEGTGLGLALVADIARAHGGHVQVESAPGAGSTFTMHIPIGGVA